jgi:hypothetical protein
VGATGKAAARHLSEAFATATPYVAHLSVRRCSATPPEGMVSLPGLLFFHYLHDGDITVLVTYWRSREDYLRNEDPLMGLLADVEPGVITAGHVSTLSVPAKPLLKRVPWVTLLGLLFGILGAVEVTRTWWYRFTELPDISVFSARPGAVNYLPGQEMVEPIQITSHAPVEQRVTITPVTVCRLGSSVPVAETTWYPHEIRELREDQSAALLVSATSPSEAGLYDLVFQTTVRAGRMRGNVPKQYRVRFKVWSSVPFITTVPQRSSSPFRALFHIEVPYAAPRGLVCTTTVLGVPDVAAIIQQMGGSRAKGPLQSSSSAASQRWVTHAFPAFATGDIPILVVSKSASTPAANSRIILECTERKTGGSDDKDD